MSTHDADHLQEVHRVALNAARAAGVHSSELEDVAADAVVKVMEHPHDPARGTLTTYVYSIVRHLWMNRAEKYTTRRAHLHRMAHEPRADADAPPAALMRAERVGMVRDALSGLDARGLAVMGLRLRGVPHAAIAGITALNPGTAKSTIHRSRVRVGIAIRQRLADAERVRPSLRTDRSPPAPEHAQ